MTLAFGVNDQSLYAGINPVNPSLAAMLGATYVRQPLGWLNLETASGVYNPSYMAQMLSVEAAYKAVGLTTIWSVSAIPNWANGNAGQNGIPTSTSSFTTFMTYLCTQMPGRIWELFNEPDGNSFFVPTSPPTYTVGACTLVAAAASTNSTITSTNSFTAAGVAVGQTVTGTGITGTVTVTYVSANLIVVSVAAGGSISAEASETLTFTATSNAVAGTYTYIEQTLANAYSPFVVAAYPAMKTADPTCTVIAGALGSTPLNTTFYEQCVSNGMVGHYDVFSVHLYPNGGDINDPNPTSYYNPLLNTFQAARTAASDTAPLWITEFGWASAPAPYDPEIEGTNSYLYIVSQQNQAYRYANMIAGMQARGDIPVLVQYQLQDTQYAPTGNPSTDHGGWYGITDYHSNQKQAFAAIQQLLNPTATRFFNVSGTRYRNG